MSAAWLVSGLRPLLEVNLAAAAGILLVLVLRRPVLRAFGARAAYSLWLGPILAAAAVMVPARMAPPETSPPPRSPEAILVLTQTATPNPVSTPIEPDLILWIWLAGAVVGLSWLVLSHLRFLAAERSGRAGPAVVGVLAPRIVLPADFEARFEPGERTAILAHERAHLRGQDSRINAFASVLACLAWFNPLVHLAARRMRLDQDLACDEAALAQRPGQARLYAATLLKAQMNCAGSPAGCSFGAHPLAERIAQAGRPRPNRARRMAGMALALGLAFSGAVAAWATQPARPAPITASSDRASLTAALPPRAGAPIVVASRTPAARQLLAEAVPSSPQGETMITTSPAPRRLAAAAVLALGLGTGSVQAAAPTPVPTVATTVTTPPAVKISPPVPLGTTTPVQVKADQGLTYAAASRPSPPSPKPPPPPKPPTAPPRPVMPPREVPPAPRDASALDATRAALLLSDGRRIECSPTGDPCMQALASLMMNSAEARALANEVRVAAQAEALNAKAQAKFATDAQVQALVNQTADLRAQAQLQAAKAQLDAAQRGQPQ